MHALAFGGKPYIERTGPLAVPAGTVGDDPQLVSLGPAAHSDPTPADPSRSALLYLIGVDNSRPLPADELAARMDTSPAYPQSRMEKLLSRAMATQRYYGDHPERLVEQTQFGRFSKEGVILVARALVTLIGLALNIPAVIANVSQAAAVSTVVGGSYAADVIAILLPMSLAGLFAIMSLSYSTVGHKSFALRYSVLGSFAHAFIFFGLWCWGIGSTPLATITTSSLISWASQAFNDIQLFTVMLINLYYGDGKLWAHRPVGTFSYVAGGMILTILALAIGTKLHGLNIIATSQSSATCALSSRFEIVLSNATGSVGLGPSYLASSAELYTLAGFWTLSYQLIPSLDVNLTITVGPCDKAVPSVSMSDASGQEYTAGILPNLLYMCSGDSTARPTTNLTIYRISTTNGQVFVGCPPLDELFTLSPTSPVSSQGAGSPTLPATFSQGIVATLLSESTSQVIMQSAASVSSFNSYQYQISVDFLSMPWTNMVLTFQDMSKCNWTSTSTVFFASSFILYKIIPGSLVYYPSYSVYSATVTYADGSSKYFGTSACTQNYACPVLPDCSNLSFNFSTTLTGPVVQFSKTAGFGYPTCVYGTTVSPFPMCLYLTSVLLSGGATLSVAVAVTDSNVIGYGSNFTYYSSAISLNPTLGWPVQFDQTLSNSTATLVGNPSAQIIGLGVAVGPATINMDSSMFYSDLCSVGGPKFTLGTTAFYFDTFGDWSWAWNSFASQWCAFDRVVATSPTGAIGYNVVYFPAGRPSSAQPLPVPTANLPVDFYSFVCFDYSNLMGFSSMQICFSYDNCLGGHALIASGATQYNITGVLYLRSAVTGITYPFGLNSVSAGGIYHGLGEFSC